MADIDTLDREHALLTAVARFDELRTRDAAAARAVAGDHPSA